jgi:hypothetical protein
MIRIQNHFSKIRRIYFFSSQFLSSFQKTTSQNQIPDSAWESEAVSCAKRDLNKANWPHWLPNSFFSSNLVQCPVRLAQWVSIHIHFFCHRIIILISYPHKFESEGNTPSLPIYNFLDITFDYLSHSKNVKILLVLLWFVVSLDVF